MIEAFPQAFLCCTPIFLAIMLFLLQKYSGLSILLICMQVLIYVLAPDLLILALISIPGFIAVLLLLQEKLFMLAIAIILAIVQVAIYLANLDFIFASALASGIMCIISIITNGLLSRAEKNAHTTIV